MFSFEASKTRQCFLARFEPDGDNFLYRRFSEAVPVRISARDRQFMIDGFDGSWVYFPYGAAAAIIAVCLFAYAIFAISDFPHAGKFAVMGALIVPAWWADLWDGPNRALFLRATDMGKTQQLPYLTRGAGNLGWRAMLFFLYWILREIENYPKDRTATGWNNLFLAIALIALAYLVCLAIRKLQMVRARSLPYLNEVH